jgi:quercetin dioxygenase-like cupin family protein
MQIRNAATEIVHLVDDGELPLVDLFGPVIQFLVPPGIVDEAICVIKGIMPPGACVPIHSHVDVESFFVITGQLEVLTESDGDFGWIAAGPGSFIEAPSGAKHALRNTSDQPAVTLICTTSRMGRFFEEVGRPVDAEARLGAPTSDELRRFAGAAVLFGYWLASAEENVKAGLPSL